MLQNLVALESSRLGETADFLSRTFNVDPSIYGDWFPHWWDRNPAWTAEIPRGWVALSDCGEVIGFTANIPLHYVFNGTKALCLVTGSTAVAAYTRRMGIARALGKAFVEQERGALLVGTKSTPAAFRLWQSLGMDAVDQPWQSRSHRVLANVAAWGAVRLGTVAGITAGLMFRPLDWHYRRQSSSIKTQKVDRFEASDTGGVERCRASNATCYAFRDIDIANWLFFGSEFLKRTRAVFAARSGSELVGYLALKREGIAYEMIECRCFNADAEIARELVLAARRWAQEQNAAYLMIRPYTPMLTKAVPRLCTLNVAETQMTYCFKFRIAASITSLETGPGDGDVSLN